MYWGLYWGPLFWETTLYSLGFGVYGLGLRASGLRFRVRYSSAQYCYIYVYIYIHMYTIMLPQAKL